MVLEAGEVGFPEAPGAEVPVVELGREVEVDALDVFGEDGGAGTETDGEELARGLVGRAGRSGYWGTHPLLREKTLARYIWTGRSE